jgi:hypothetical protein
MVTLPKIPLTIDLGDQGQLNIDTDLSQKQIAKFKGLIDGLIVVDNTAYLRLDELHGVLLTSSKQQAQEIVNVHRDLMKPYFVTDKVKFAPFGVIAAIKPAGMYVLLDRLATINAKRAPEYRSSLVVLSYIMAKHPGVRLGDWKNAKAQFDSVTKAMRNLKKLHIACQLTGHPFHSGDEKHVHHIEGRSENPSLAADANNLVVLHNWVHNDYHSWVIERGMPVCRASLFFYADRRGYSTGFTKTRA